MEVQERLELFSLYHFSAFVGAARRTNAVGELRGFALWTGGYSRSSQEIVGSSHVFARLGCFLLRYCHKVALLLLVYLNTLQRTEFEIYITSAAIAGGIIEVSPAITA